MITDLFKERAIFPPKSRSVVWRWTLSTNALIRLEFSEEYSRNPFSDAKYSLVTRIDLLVTLCVREFLYVPCAIHAALLDANPNHLVNLKFHSLSYVQSESLE
jgi:hypothetical protein